MCPGVLWALVGWFRCWLAGLAFGVMRTSDIRASTVAERRAIADFLAGLDEAALAVPSLCAGWGVRTVGAHLALAASGSVAGFFLTTVKYRGDFDRANELSRRMARRPISEIVQTLRRSAGRRLANPGQGSRGPLTDVLVHAGDMRRPLGLPHRPDLPRVKEVLLFLSGPRSVGFVARGLTKGLRFVADDAGFAFGAGPEVRGRAADLMMVLCGRGAVLPDLQGPGLDLLGPRLAQPVS